MSSRFIVSEAMEHRSNYKKKWSLLTKGVGLKHGQQTNPKSITFCMNSYQSNLRQEAIDTLGASCIICGFSDSRALQFDHVEGNGNDDRKKISWSTRYREIIAGSSKYQLLCANCNWIKRSIKKEAIGRPRDKVLV